MTIIPSLISLYTHPPSLSPSFSLTVLRRLLRPPPLPLRRPLPHSAAPWIPRFARFDTPAKATKVRNPLKKEQEPRKCKPSLSPATSCSQLPRQQPNSSPPPSPPHALSPPPPSLSLTVLLRLQQRNYGRVSDENNPCSSRGFKRNGSPNRADTETYIGTKGLAKANMNKKGGTKKVRKESARERSTRNRKKPAALNEPKPSSPPHALSPQWPALVDAQFLLDLIGKEERLVGEEEGKLVGRKKGSSDKRKRRKRREEEEEDEDIFGILKICGVVERNYLGIEGKLKILKILRCGEQFLPCI